MLKYGNIIHQNLGTTKTLLPRNLTYSNSIFNSQTVNNQSIINNSTQNILNYNSASIDSLNVNSINIIANTATSCIAIQSPITFSLLPLDYQDHNFNIYPIYFTQDILINNNNFNLQSNNVIIKDNVLIINNELSNITINLNTSDSIISGIIFPIADQNNSTGYYAGLLYIPNNKIKQSTTNTLYYNWIEDQYNYFTNNNKGFFKLKYLPQTLNFNNYNNNMNEQYMDLIDNNNNLSNLITNSLALYDGEIVGLNNNLKLNLSDGNTITELIHINNFIITIYNNLGLKFINNLIISDSDNIQYINFNKLLNTIIFYKNILFNNNNTIYFNDILNIASNSNIFITFTNSNYQIELFGNVIINTLQIISSFELNNIPFNFINNLYFKSGNTTFMDFNSILNITNIYIQTNINNLLINSCLEFANTCSCIFNSSFYINDNNQNNYIYFDGINTQLLLLVSTYSNNLYINKSLNLLNNSPIIVLSSFIIQTNNYLLASFDISHTIFQNNLLLKHSNPSITFNYGSTLNISDDLNIINLNINSSIDIIGPNSNYPDISNIIVDYSFCISNTTTIYNNLTFIPYTKIYIASGLTNIDSNIIFQFNNVLNINNFSGKLLGTTWALNSLFINTYEINLWSYPFINKFQSKELILGYNTVEPINNINNGDWYIDNLYIYQPNNNGIYNLYISCIGSKLDHIIWSFKLDILQI